MKAILFKQPEKALVLENIPVPTPQKGEILVKIVACGVCHTDIHYIYHGISTLKTPPLVLGHEISGITASKGEIFKSGERVLLPAVFSCGKCEYCKQGKENLCKNFIMPGNSVDGGFAQYICAPEHNLIRMPDEIPLEEGCIIADAISTPYHAVVNRAKVKSGDRILIIGCGGVGINVVQLCTMFGAEVTVCDINSKKLEKALEFGAKYIVNPSKIPIKEFTRQNGGLYDIVFEVIGLPHAMEEGYKLLKPAGKLCVIGYTNKNISINPAKLMFFEQEIIGSVGCPQSDYLKIFELVKFGKIKLHEIIDNKYELEDINKAIEELISSKVFRNIILPNGKGQDNLYFL